MLKKRFPIFLFLFFALSFVFVNAQFEEEFPTEENGNEGASESACYLWYDNIDGISKCTSSAPSRNRANSYVSYSNCICLSGASPEITGCSSTISGYSVHQTGENSYGFQLDTRVVNSDIGDPTECSLCSEGRELTQTMLHNFMCDGTFGNTEGCNDVLYATFSSGLARSCEYIYSPSPPEGQQACWVMDEGSEGTHWDGSVQTTNTLSPPCCLDQDGDGHGIEEYDENMCGSVEFGDCWDGPGNIIDVWEDEEQREIAGQVWRGCTRYISSLQMDLLDETSQKLVENNVNFFYRENNLLNLIGKHEKCDQNNDWNKDGVDPWNDWDCQFRNDWQEPSHPDNGEWEYPVEGKMYVDGNKIKCTFTSENEETRWGDLRLEQQKFHLELQKKNKPSDDWQTHYSHGDINLADDDCSDNNCCVLINPAVIPEGMGEEQYLRDHKEGFYCRGWFDIETSLRGNQIRCLAYPYNDAKNDYWKAMNVTTADALVPDHSTVVLPADFFIGGLQILAVFDGQGHTPGAGAPEMLSAPIPINNYGSRHSTLSSGPGTNDDIHDYMNFYLDYASDANSNLKFSHKSIFVENYNSPSDNGIIKANRFIATLRGLPDPNYLVATRRARPGDTINIRGPTILHGTPDDNTLIKVHGQLKKWGYKFIPGRDTIVLEYAPVSFQIPNAQTLQIPVPLQGGGRLIYSINLRVGTPVDMGGIRAFTQGSGARSGQKFIAFDVGSSAEVLSHEYGHEKQDLCEEYDLKSWAKQAAWSNGQGSTCRNEFPLCCLGTGPWVIQLDGRTVLSGTVANSCGTNPDCPGTPYYADSNGHDVPDPLGTFPNAWQWRSAMGVLWDRPIIYPTTGGASGYKGTDLCELRKWPHEPKSHRICQQV